MCFETNGIWRYACATYPDWLARETTWCSSHPSLTFRFSILRLQGSKYFQFLCPFNASSASVRWNLQSCLKWHLLFPSKSYARLPQLLQQNSKHPTVLPLTIDTNRARGICLFAKMHRKSSLPEEQGNVEDTDFSPTSRLRTLDGCGFLYMSYFTTLLIIFNL